MPGRRTVLLIGSAGFTVTPRLAGLADVVGVVLAVGAVVGPLVEGRSAGWPGQRPLDALEAHFLDGMQRRDPITGLCDDATVLAFHRLVFQTPSLASRLATSPAPTRTTWSALDGASLRSRLLATAIIAVRQILAHDNWAELAAGRSADERYPQAVTATHDAFELLSKGAARRGY